ncbi:hypothetical protein ACI1T5_00985 [Lactococcus petauri]|uniref:hypothetical protein n=1 Tax=Lactococcus petauri TaxID=1940789 RepID=UPI0002F9DA1B|nr:hypothetical protein [Lactococcus petauri]APC44677.1 hypothetical protein [Lactococcus phage PLg-TB25]MDT2620595.1 hypothetical protein [Lactococcus petauri]
MNNNWGIIAAIVSALAAAIGLFFQRRDIKKQNRYQRDTFELQNKIDENSLMTDLASKMISNTLSLLSTKITLCTQILDEKQRWSTRVSGLGRNNVVFETMTLTFYEKSLSQLRVLESDNKQKTEDLMSNIYKLEIIIVQLKEDKQNKIKELIDETIKEFELMDIFIKGARELGSKDSYDINLENWSKEYKFNIENICEEFKQIFIKIKKDTLCEISEIKS